MSRERSIDPGSWRAPDPTFSADVYDRRWRDLAASGQNPHGEADRLMRYAPTSVLDAGCGTGRVAIELANRGVRAVGVDLDEIMLEGARRKAPEQRWIHGDLATVVLDETFDVVVLAGNVMLFVADRAAVVANMAGCVRPDGILVAGFQVAWPGRHLPLETYDALCVDAGLELEERTATWAGDPYEGGDYSVSVHRAVSAERAVGVERAG